MKTDKEILDEIFPPIMECRWCGAKLTTAEDKYCSDDCKRESEKFDKYSVDPSRPVSQGK